MSRPRAVLLDALGTLLTFAPPAPLLAERLGVAPQDAERAIRAEIAYYRAHLHEGSDAAGLAALRLRCAQLVRDELRLDAPAETVLPALLDAIRFEPYPDAIPALRELRAAGLRLVVASNWDVSLHEALARTGLVALLDGAVASAEVGSAKPDGAIFARALALAGVEPAAAWHVGDLPEADVEGARRARITPVLIVREPGPPAPSGVEVIASLAELPGLLRAAAP
ncbi:MAG: HAD family hydrolase [Actinomycetota bacterium]|nr:HAD family hydrolase [Actinomycetota bacterium]